MTTNEIHKTEVNTISKIFRRSGIRFLPEIKIEIKNDKTDIDVFGIYENIVFLVECFGEESFGQKIKKTITDFNLIENNFEEVKEILKKDYPPFYASHKDVLEGSSLIFKKLIVSSKKETIKEVEKVHQEIISGGNFGLWTHEEIYYYEKVSDCTYGHCKYEILGNLNVSPTEITKGEESGIPSYPAYGKEISSGVFLLNLVIPIKILLKRATIKRLRDSNTNDGYQRLLNKAKLKSMRNYLLKENPNTYPNNIICVLNKESLVSPINNLLEEIKFKQNERRRSDNIRDIKQNLFIVDVPNRYDVFEIVDGQHRLFSFGQDSYSLFEKVKEGDKERIKEEDARIRSLAEKQNLTVTAIYSKTDDIWSNPGKLFLDINTKQTSIMSEDIIDLVEKYDKENNEPVIEANLLLKKLNENGFLRNKIKFKPWQDDRIKRVSLIGHSGFKEIFDKKKKTHKLFWEAYEKQTKIENYSDFCFILANNFLIKLGNLLKEKDKRNYEKIVKDMSLKEYYFLSAVFIGSLFRLLRHFLCGDKNKLNIVDHVEESLVKGDDEKKTFHKNLDNKALQNLFEEGLKHIIEKYSFDKNEFVQQEGWGSNKWAKIEADLFYLIRNKVDKNFGDESLVSKNHRQ